MPLEVVVKEPPDQEGKQRDAKGEEASHVEKEAKAQ